MVWYGTVRYAMVDAMQAADAERGYYSRTLQ